ncbi:four helix bundle protein [Roseivirga sp. UBA1976]|uniref:four helix bundle protein n=1 Tax=Roseivirga sp. UBA1976 TaxID=1947386 RepID=UPI00257C326E|nr:four helix bundle protein [Roseivirga sp. UBA1976]MEC7754331.1 four helix bundle protein [Bacteroidota bacterium]|tara:strand:- start:10277 stop:10510 length:234 start_codon:yes stop_codon:yes gene_type:complete
MNTYTKTWSGCLEKVTTLTVEVYTLNGHIRENERIRLTSQIKRAALSVSLKIAKGAGDSSGEELDQLNGLAQNSTLE